MSSQAIGTGSAETLGEWGLYAALLVMVVTAVAQVKYINRGMALFGNSEVTS